VLVAKGSTITTGRGKGTLESDHVVAKALEIVDREGLNGLTMRGLASELGVGVMTLYGHFRTKDELVELLTERAISELEIPETGSWDEQIHELFTNLRELLKSHPSILEADAARPLSGPAALRAANASLGMLRSGGLDDDRAVSAMSSLISFTFGSAMFRRNRDDEAGSEYALRVRGADPDELEHVSYLAPQMLERGTDDEFDFGLRIIVDGLVRTAEEDR